MRRAVGGLLVVVAMAAMTTGAALGASSSSGGMTGSVLVAASTPEELCDLLARGAESRLPWSSDGVPVCIGGYGPDASTNAEVLELATAADALRRLNVQVDLFRESQWPRSSVELGETGYEFDATGLEWEAIPDFELGFVRGPYWVIVRTYVLGGGSKEMVRRLAEEIDQNIEALLGGGQESDTDGGGGSGPDAPGNDPWFDISGLFWGADRSQMNWPALGKIVECDGAEPSTAAEFWECSGTAESRGLVVNVEDAFMRRFHDPWSDPGRVEAAIILKGAVSVGAIQGKDGQPLFPSVVAATAVIEELVANGTLHNARRLLGMLMALDASTWDNRFPAGRSR